MGEDVKLSSKRFLNGSPSSLLFILVVAETIISLDFSLVTIALPSIQSSFGLSAITAQWILTVDIIIYGGFMIVGGRFADNYGERSSLTLGLGLFLLGSTINVLSNTLEPLLVGRAMQGFGAAFTFPATIALLTRTFPSGPARFRALTISTAVQATGVPLGTMAAGFLATTFGGTAAFMLNIPICVLLLLLVRHGLPGKITSKPRKSIPVASAVVLAIGMGLLLQSALAIVAKDEQTRAIAPYAFSGSVAALATFAFIQRKSPNPLFSFSLFRIENLGMYILITSMMIMVGKGMVVLSNISFQQGLGYSAWEASLALIPMALSAVLLVFLTPFISGPLLRAPRASLAIGFMLMASLHFTLAQMPGAFAGVVLLIILFIQPYFSVTSTNLGVHEIMARAPVENQGVVAAMLYTTVQIVGGLGLALLIAAKDQRAGIIDDFTRFSPSFMLATSVALLGMFLLVVAIKPSPLLGRSSASPSPAIADRDGS